MKLREILRLWADNKIEVYPGKNPKQPSLEIFRRSDVDKPSDEYKFPSSPFYSNLMNDLLKDEIKLFSKRWPDKRPYIEVEKELKHYFAIMPDGVELIENDLSIIEKWVDGDYERTGKKTYGSSYKIIEEIKLGNFLYAQKEYSKECDEEIIEQIQGYKNLQELIAKLGINKNFRIPKLYFADEMHILMESLFSFQTMYDLDFSQDNLKICLENLIKASKIEDYLRFYRPEHFFIEPQFVIVDPNIFDFY